MPGALHECAPGRASSFQTCRTGFDSSRSCFLPTWLDLARRRSCKPDDAGANPVVGSGRAKSGESRARTSEVLLWLSAFRSRLLAKYGPWVCRIACQRPKLVDQVRLLDGLLTTRPASVPDRTADFDSARRGSIPRRATEIPHVLGVCRIAREPAKLVDQVRFLAGTLNDAGARRHGNRLQPGRSGFDSHRRLSTREQRHFEETIPPGQRRTDRESKFRTPDIRPLVRDRFVRPDGQMET